MEIITNPHKIKSINKSCKIKGKIQQLVVDDPKEQCGDDLSAIWNELGTYLIILDQHESIKSCPPLASQLTYCSTYPELIESLSEGWILLLGIHSSDGGGAYIVFPENTCDPTLQAVVAQYKHTWSHEPE